MFFLGEDGVVGFDAVLFEEGGISVLRLNNLTGLQVETSWKDWAYPWPWMSGCGVSLAVEKACSVGRST